jgi:hypothetical protein
MALSHFIMCTYIYCYYYCLLLLFLTEVLYLSECQPRKQIMKYRYEGFTLERFFWIAKPSPLAWYLDQGLTWLHTLMKASRLTLHFDKGVTLFLFFLWKMKYLPLASYFDEGFLLWLHTFTKALHLASYFDEGLTVFSFSLWKTKSLLWIHTLTKASLLASYFDEGFTPDFELWRRLLTLISHLDEGLTVFSFSLWKTSL